MKRKKIIHIATGGTIEGLAPEYEEIGELATVFSDVTDISKFVQKSFRFDGSYKLEVVCRKDSRDITKTDRDAIVRLIKKYYKKGVRAFLITHGTYTMPETGKYLLSNIPQAMLEEISVVITGAMFPLNLIGSDALLNIGAAISTLNNYPEPLGVTISMHGTNWDPRKVRKDSDKLIFESK